MDQQITFKSASTVEGGKGVRKLHTSTDQDQWDDLIMKALICSRVLILPATDFWTLEIDHQIWESHTLVFIENAQVRTQGV